MFSPRSHSKPDGPLTVHVPAPADDRPSWAKVAVIAAIGFVVGVAWPRLAGVRLGPSVPESASIEAVAPVPSARAAPTSAPPAPAPSSGLAVAPAATTAIALVPAPPATQTSPEVAAKGHAGGGLTVGRGFVFACKTADGESLKSSQCGKLLGLDAVVLPRLRLVEACPASATVSGKMHFVVRADFARGTLAAEFGKSQGPDAPEGLLACVRTSLAGASVAGVQHDYPAYAVAYTLAFGAPGAAAAAAIAPAPAAPPPSSGAAEGSSLVVWDVALVRDAPKTGKVIARLQRGTPLRLGSSKDGWYTVKFGDGFSSDGWVFRGAVGR